MSEGGSSESLVVLLMLKLRRHAVTFILTLKCVLIDSAFSKLGQAAGSCSPPARTIFHPPACIIDDTRASPLQPSPAHSSPAQPSTAQPSPAQPSTAQHSPASPARAGTMSRSADTRYLQSANSSAGPGRGSRAQP